MLSLEQKQIFLYDLGDVVVLCYCITCTYLPTHITHSQIVSGLSALKIFVD